MENPNFDMWPPHGCGPIGRVKPCHTNSQARATRVSPPSFSFSLLTLQRQEHELPMARLNAAVSARLGTTPRNAPESCASARGCYGPDGRRPYRLCHRSQARSRARGAGERCVYLQAAQIQFLTFALAPARGARAPWLERCCREIDCTMHDSGMRRFSFADESNG